MAYELLTNLIFEPKGKHDPSLTYTIKDTVMSDDGSKVYFARKDVPAGIPLTDTEYWMLQMDLSSSKNAMDTAAATAKTQTDAVTKSAQDRVDSMVDTAADAIANLNDYTEQYGLRVRGETQKASGNPVKIYPDAGSLLKPVTTIEVVQEGSGDPYPAGGGKNLLPSLSESVTTNGITFAPHTDGKVEVSGTLSDTEKGAIAYLMQSVELPAGTYTLSGSDDPAVPITIAIERNSGTVDYYNADSGIARTFNLAAGDRVSVYVQVYNFREFSGNAIVAQQLERGSVATDFEKHENIRPFIGYDKLGLNHAGKNLCNISPFLSAWATENAAMLSLLNTLAPGTYTVSVVFEMQNPERASATDKCGLFFYPYAERVFVEWGSVAVGTTRRVTCTFNVTADNAGKFTAAYFYGCGADGIGYTGYATAKDVQLEIGSTATPYEPYQGKAYAVQIGQTVYRGKLDWLTGKLTKIWPAVMLRDLTMSYKGGDHNYFEINMPSDALATADFLCESYKNVGVLYYSAMPTTPTGCMGYYPQDRVWRLKDTRYTSVDELLAGNGDMKIVYKLATPIEIQLTPTAVLATETEGVNYIYGDGDIEVEYVIPLKQSIAKRVNMLLDTFAEPFEKTGDIVTCEPVAGIEFDSVVSTIEPQQEGSGDPYPAGGGKNLLPITAKTQTINGVTFTVDNGVITVNGTASANAYLWLCDEFVLQPGTYVMSGIPENFNYDTQGGFTDDNWSINRYGVTTLTEAKKVKPYIVVRNGVTASNVVFKLQLELGSVATDYAPPSNIRPFIGYDALDLNHAGKNLFTGWVRGERIDGTTGAFYALATGARTGYIPVKPSEQMQVIGLTSTMNSFVAFYNAEKNFIDRTSGYGSEHRTINVPENCHYIAITQYEYSGMSGVIADLSDAVQLEFGASIPTENTAPTGIEEYTVQIGQTVYGIRYEWLTGKGAIEWAMYTVTVGDFAKNGANQFVMTHNLSAQAFAECACSHFIGSKRGAYDSAVNNSATVSGTGLWFYSKAFETAEEFNAFINAQNAAGTPVQIVYKLATPIEIQLTPTEIIALSGVNNLYGSGKTTVAGRQSKDVDILRRLTTLETLLTNQTKGE